MANPMNDDDYASNDEQIAALKELACSLNSTHGIKEVIFDMSFALGRRWNRWPRQALDTLMDRLGGSRGLYDWLRLEASNFEAMWVALDEQDPRREDYYGEVDDYFQAAVDKLILREIGNV